MHDRGHASCEGARDGDLARKEAPDPFRLTVAVRPASGRCDRDDRARASSLGQLEREGSPRRIPDDVGAVHTEFVEMGLERVGGGRVRRRTAERIGRAAVMTREGGSDHFVTSDKLAEQRAPVVPGAREAVQQQDRLSDAGTVEGGRYLSQV